VKIIPNLFSVLAFRHSGDLSDLRYDSPAVDRLAPWGVRRSIFVYIIFYHFSISVVESYFVPELSAVESYLPLILISAIKKLFCPRTLIRFYISDRKLQNSGSSGEKREAGG
jgi:hypothetical protein